MRRVIVDFKKLTPEVLKLTIEKFPDGYDDDDIISFRNAHGERIEAVEVLTEDTKYLVKISEKLEKTMANYDESDYEDFDNDGNLALNACNLFFCSEIPVFALKGLQLRSVPKLLGMPRIYTQAKRDKIKLNYNWSYSTENGRLLLVCFAIP